MSIFSAKLELDGQEPFQIEDSGGSQGIKFSQHIKMISGDNEELASAFCISTIEEISQIVASARRWNAIRDNWSGYSRILSMDVTDNEVAEFFFTCYQTEYRGLNQNQKNKIEDIMSATFDGIMGRFCIKLYGEGINPLGHNGYVHGLSFYEGIRGTLNKLSKTYRSVHLNSSVTYGRSIDEITHTFVHECTHKYAGTIDSFYIDRDQTGNYTNRIPRRHQATGLTFANYLAGITVDDRINNADSTTWFCKGMMKAILSKAALYAGGDGVVHWSSSLYQNGERQQARLQAGCIN